MKKHDQAQTTAEGCCFHVSEHPDTPMKCGGWDCSDEEYNYSGYVRDVLNGGW